MNPVAIYPYKEDAHIRKMRVQAWYRAVVKTSGLSTRDLERKFSESDAGRKVNRSCVWNRYRRGEVVPRSGQKPGGGVNLVDRVEAEYPETAKWLYLPMWRLLDRAPMEMSEIRQCYQSLPPPIRSIFIHQEAEPSSLFWRTRPLDCKREGELLLRFESLDGLTAVLVMQRESIIVQCRQQHAASQVVLREYSRRLEKHPFVGQVLRRFASNTALT